MHYYQFNIGDYRRRTGYLSPLEHGIYRVLLDTYYLEEEPLCADDAVLMRTHNIRTGEEGAAFKNVINDFFELRDDGYHHAHCDEEIAKFHDKSAKASASAKARWNKDTNAVLTHSEGNANHKPLTTNQKKDSQEKPPAHKFSEDDVVTAEYIFKLILNLNPGYKKPNLNKWADDVRLTRERDGRTNKEICELFKWANNHHFWKTNILSPDKLRKKWDDLIIQVNHDPKDGAETKQTKLPAMDDQLEKWAKDNGYPQSREGEYYPQYRSRLNRLIEEKTERGIM